jgi:hypothetical protein
MNTHPESASKLPVRRLSLKFLFRKQPTLRALAEVLEDGRTIASQEVKKNQI